MLNAERPQRLLYRGTQKDVILERLSSRVLQSKSDLNQM
jgi:hypothetical protein